MFLSLGAKLINPAVDQATRKNKTGASYLIPLECQTKTPES